VLVENSDADPDPLDWLDEPERYAYDHFLANRNKRGQAETFPLAPGIQAGMFELYLNGTSLAQIRATFPQFGLGQIVHAAVDGRWNEHRAGYITALMSRAKDRAVQVAAESVNFISDAMAAAHKLHGAAFKKFLASGDPNDLGAFGVGSPKQYRDWVETLMKVTGQDGQRRVAGTVKHEHVVRTIPTAPPPPVQPATAVAALGTWGQDELAKNSDKED
jgi:hypothetical protein